jgi:hypothetical protein
MTFTDWVRAIFKPYRENAVVVPAKRATTEQGKPITSGRVSNDSANSVVTKGWTFVSPADHETNWRLQDVDVTHLDRFTPKELLDMLIDISPEIARAVWDFQRLCNPGWEVKAYELGSEDTESAKAKEHITSFFHLLRDQYGSVDVVLGRFFIGAYLRGAFCSELVLDSSGLDSVDLVAPDPFSIRFRRRNDAVRGEVWQPGQWQGGRGFIPLDIPTFRYIPVDPAPGSPYGRSLAQPALFSAIFALGLLHDVKRVVMQQGYKRMDIVIDSEKAMDVFAYDPQGFASLGEYIRAAVADIEDTYADLEPEDAFIHTDIFKLEEPAGTIDSDSIGAIDKIMERLEGSITRGLKSNSLIMDTVKSSSEADSNRRWEIHSASVKSLQHFCEAMLESQLTLSLRAKGIQARVVFKFAELRAAEMFRDEQTQALKTQNARNNYEAGFISQDEAANDAVNHNADVPEPRKPLTKIDSIQDNSSGNEALYSGTDDRTVFPLKGKEVVVDGHKRD